MQALVLLKIPVRPSKSSQRYYFSFFNIGVFIVFRQQSPEKFANVFLTPQYAVMAGGVSFCQIGAVAVIRHFTPEEDLELTPLRVIMLVLFANIVLAVFMAILNGLMLVK